MRRRLALAAALLLPTQAALAQASESAGPQSGSRGYWWYQAPPKVEKAEEEKPEAIDISKVIDGDRMEVLK